MTTTSPFPAKRALLIGIGRYAHLPPERQLHEVRLSDERVGQIGPVEVPAQHEVILEVDNERVRGAFEVLPCCPDRTAEPATLSPPDDLSVEVAIGVGEHLPVLEAAGVVVDDQPLVRDVLGGNREGAGQDVVSAVGQNEE